MIGVRVVAEQVLVTVSDDGPRIPSVLLPKVFNRSARGDTSRSRAAGSTGLGLAIVAAVVAAHHGSVDVVSEPGCTVFTVRLPLFDEATSSASPADSAGAHDEPAGVAPPPTLGA